MLDRLNDPLDIRIGVRRPEGGLADRDPPFVQDAEGLPLVVQTTPANTRDDQIDLDLVIGMPPIAGRAAVRGSSRRACRGIPGTAARRWHGW